MSEPGESPARGSRAETVERVWEKASVLPATDPGRWRADAHGNLLFRDSYGLETRCGWEIYFKVPPERGGTDRLANLEPLQWEAGTARGLVCLRLPVPA